MKNRKSPKSGDFPVSTFRLTLQDFRGVLIGSVMYASEVDEFQFYIIADGFGENIADKLGKNDGYVVFTAVFVCFADEFDACVF